MAVHRSKCPYAASSIKRGALNYAAGALVAILWRGRRVKDARGGAFPRAFALRLPSLYRFDDSKRDSDTIRQVQF